MALSRNCVYRNKERIGKGEGGGDKGRGKKGEKIILPKKKNKSYQEYKPSVKKKNNT